MDNKPTFIGKPFQRIKDACQTTGLSQYYLRRGCKEGSIPCIKSGNGKRPTYYIDMVRFLEQMRGDGI